jgi:hypothetical protein
MASKTDVMTTLCSAFGVFNAFGAAILAFFTAGGGLQRLSSWLVRRRQAAAGHPEPGGRALRPGNALVWLVAGVVGLAVTVSGIGLFTSFFWLVATASNTGSVPKWAYACAEDMFYIEACVITIVTVVAIISTALAALPTSRATPP